MGSVKFLLVIALAIVASGYLLCLPPFALPLPLAQIALGALIAEVFGSNVPPNPEIFLLLILAPPLFLDGWRFPKGGRCAIDPERFGVVPSPSTGKSDAHLETAIKGALAKYDQRPEIHTLNKTDIANVAAYISSNEPK